MRKALLLTAFPMLCLGPYTHAATWYVDASVVSSGDGTSWDTAFKTIQEGIDAASHGDEVIAAPGTYSGNVRFKAKNITLTSTDPLDPNVVGRTTIRGGGPVVAFYGTEDQSCTLSGFTITGGAAGIWG